MPQANSGTKDTAAAQLDVVLQHLSLIHRHVHGAG